MNLSDVCSVVVALARTGKTYYMTRFIVTHLIPETKKTIYTNLPLKLDNIAEYCKKKYNIAPEITLSRIKHIDRETETRWKNSEKIPFDQLTPDQQANLKPDGGLTKGSEPFVYDGIWLYFWDKELDGSIIILDEIHNFCGTHHCKAIQARWRQFIAELGHRKSMIRGITQNYGGLGEGVKLQVASQYLIENTSLRKIPYFGIPFYDVQMMLKAFFGVPFYQPILLLQERVDPLNPRKKLRDGLDSCVMSKEIFGLYDSFNKPIEGSQEVSAESAKKMFMDTCDSYRKQHGKILGAIWLGVDFLLNHYLRLIVVGGYIGAIAYLVLDFKGVTNWIIQQVKTVTSESVAKKAKINEVKPQSGVAQTVTAPRVAEAYRLPPAGFNSQSEYPSICAIMPDGLFLSNGVLLRVGDDFGDTKIKEINYKYKKIILENKKVVNLVFGANVEQKNEKSSSSNTGNTIRK